MKFKKFVYLDSTTSTQESIKIVKNFFNVFPVLYRVVQFCIFQNFKKVTLYNQEEILIFFAIHCILTWNFQREKLWNVILFRWKYSIFPSLPITITVLQLEFVSIISTIVFLFPYQKTNSKTYASAFDIKSLKFKKNFKSWSKSAKKPFLGNCEVFQIEIKIISIYMIKILAN